MAARLWLSALVLAGLMGAAAAADVAQTDGSSQTTSSRGRTHNCNAFYPDSARRSNQSGDIVVGYDVSADGAITHVVVVTSSGNPVLDLAAVQCVSTQWRSLPAMKNGSPVASHGHRALVQFWPRGVSGTAPPVAPAVAKPAAAPDGSLPIILILSGLGLMGLAGVLARMVTRPGFSA
jgi:TonB family protein